MKVLTDNDNLYNINGDISESTVQSAYEDGYIQGQTDTMNKIVGFLIHNKGLVNTERFSFKEIVRMINKAVL